MFGYCVCFGASSLSLLSIVLYFHIFLFAPYSNSQEAKGWQVLVANTNVKKISIFTKTEQKNIHLYIIMSHHINIYMGTIQMQFTLNKIVLVCTFSWEKNLNVFRESCINITLLWACLFVIYLACAFLFNCVCMLVRDIINRRIQKKMYKCSHTVLA